MSAIFWLGTSSYRHVENSRDQCRNEANTDLVDATCGKRPIITALSCHCNPNLTDGGLDLCVLTRNTCLEMIQNYFYVYMILTKGYKTLRTVLKTIEQFCFNFKKTCPFKPYF